MDTKRIKLPAYLQIDRDLTDQTEWQPRQLAMQAFAMPAAPQTKRSSELIA